MAKRKSLNRRSGRFSRASVDSGHLDPDTGVLGEEESWWWRNLDGTTGARRSTILNLVNETSRQLDPTSRLDSSKGKNEWWKLLEASDAAGSKRIAQHKDHASGTGDDSNANMSGDSGSEKEHSHKKKLPFLASSRKSLKSNAFLTALNTSHESIVSLPLPTRPRSALNISRISDNVDQARPLSPRKSLGSKVNHSQSMEAVMKQRPILIGKRRKSKSRNMFDEVLKENVLDGSRTISLQRSRASEYQDSNEDNESIVAGQPRFGSSFDNNDSEASNALVPKAQSTMLECTVQMNLSDSSISEKSVQKLKPKVLKWTKKSSQINRFQDILSNEGSLEESEENMQKNNLIIEKSQRKESSRIIPSTSGQNSFDISNKKMSTSIQKGHKTSTFVTENYAVEVDDEIDDSSLCEFIDFPPYKPKSKFLSAWKKANQENRTPESHTTLVKEFGNDEQSNIHVGNTADETDIKSYEAALRKSPESNDDEFDNPEEHIECRDDSLSNKISKKFTKASHLENSVTFNQLNALSRNSKRSFTNSQKRNSKVPEDKLTETIDDHPANSETAYTFAKNAFQDKIHRSRDAHDGESSNSDEANVNYNNNMKQSLRRSPRGKSSPQRKSRTTSNTAIVVEDDPRKEDDQVAGRTMRGNSHRMRIRTSLNPLFKGDTDSEDDQINGQNTHIRSSHSISTNTVSKGSKTGTVTTAAEDVANEEDDQNIRRSLRRNKSNKSSSRRISDSPLSQVVNSLITFLSGSDEEDEIDDNKQRSSRTNIRKRSSRSILKAATPKASRTEISTVAEDDAHRDDDHVTGQSTRRSSSSKSSSRRVVDSPPSAVAKTANSRLPASDTDDEVNENTQRSSRTNISKRSSRSVLKAATPKASRTEISTVAEDDAHRDDDHVTGRSTHRSSSSKSSSRRVVDSPPSAVAKTANSRLPASDTDDEVNENTQRSSRTNISKRSSRSVLKAATPKASQTEISTVAEDDAHKDDDHVTGRSTRRSTSSKSSSRRLVDSPPSAVVKTANPLLPASDTDDEVVENTQRSSRPNIRKRSSRSVLKTATPKASRTEISTVAEDDTHKDDDQVTGRSRRRSTSNKSSSRRLGDSPTVAKTANPLLPGSNTDNEVDENTQRSSRSNIREKSSRMSKSISTRASLSKISTMPEDGDQVIGKSTRRSTRNKSSATIGQSGIHRELLVRIEKLDFGTHGISKSGKGESMISADGHDEDEDDTETFQLVTSRNGRSSSTSEGIERNLSSRIFRPRNAKFSGSYEENLDLGTEADIEDTTKLKPALFRKSSNRISRTSEVKHSTLSDDRVSESNEFISEKMRPSTKTKAVSKETRSGRMAKVSNAQTAEESVENVEKEDGPSVHPTSPGTSNRQSSISKQRLEISSDSDNSDFALIFKSHRKGAAVESVLHKRRSDASSTSDEEQSGEENEIHNSEIINRKTVNSAPRRKSVHSAADVNRSAKLFTNLRDEHFTQDNASTEEDQDTAKSDATAVSSLGNRNKIRDISSSNISNITTRSPLLSSTRRSVFPTAPSKRVSKRPPQRSNKISPTRNPSISPVDQATDHDIVIQEDERLDPDSQKSRIRMSRNSGSNQKKLSDRLRKSSNTAQALGSPLANDGHDEARQVRRRSHRVNNPIPEETSASYIEPAPNKTGKAQSAQNQHSTPVQQNRESEDIEEGATLDQSQEDSPMKIPQENSTISTIFGKKKTIADESRSKSGKSGIKERNLGKVFSQMESGMQRSIRDFLHLRAQKEFNPAFFSADFQSQLPSASQVLSDPSQMEEFKKEMDELLKEDEADSVQAKPNVSAPKKVKPAAKKVSTVLNLDTRKKPKKPIDSAYLVNGKVYKPASVPQPKYWVTKRLYQYLEKCLLPKFGLSTRVRTEKFITYLSAVTTIVEKRKKYDNYKDDMDGLLKEMAQLGIINNRNDFYHFCRNFLPYELRAKLTPILLPGNERTIPFNPKEWNTPLLQ